MKILLVSKFYYRRGGDCVYVLNLERQLRSHGHEVAIYAMNYPENEPSESQRYFASQVDFGGSKLKGAMRVLGLDDVRSSFGRMLDDFRPDVVHLNNVHSYLSPVVAGEAHRRGIRVVWTLHDYKLVCPAYSFLRDGRVCEECLSNSAAVVSHRCMKGSFAASVLAWAEARRWNRRKLSGEVDAWLCPSRFMASKMEQGGYPAERLYHIPNFISEVPADIVQERDDYYCYVGRLSGEKGVATLLDVASRLPYELRVAGDGPIGEELRAKYGGCSQIKFLGRLNADEVAGLLAHARFSVIPSEWYENNPLSGIESLCAGTPVVGARIGGIPELIDEENGITFISGDGGDLGKAIEEAWQREWNCRDIATKAAECYSLELHYQALCKIYRG